MRRHNPEDEFEAEDTREGDINLLGEPEDETLEGAAEEAGLEGEARDIDEELVDGDETEGEALIEVMEDVLDELKGLRSDIRGLVQG
jgi:hypothetical protein